MSDADERLREGLLLEQKELVGLSRELFTRFALWWAFVCTGNVAAIGAVTKLVERADSRITVAIVLALLDLCGILFCYLVCFRMVQVSDRYHEILTALYEIKYKPELSPQATVPELFAATWKNLLNEPLRARGVPNSPIPVRFYLICVVGVSGGCLLITVGWMWGIISEIGRLT